MKSNFKYLIVGGGLAGASAIEGIRERDRSGTIALFARENRLPYDRPPLSKGLWSGKAKLEDLPVHDGAFYQLHEVHLYLGTGILEIDPSGHRVLDDKGKPYTYDRLLIATGGNPRRMPFGGDAIHYFRTVEDYLFLKREIERAEEIVVIGGGFIGGELAAALSMNGRKVTMIFPDQTILQRVIPADLSSFVTEYYRGKGVAVVTDELPIDAERVGDRTIVSTRSGKKFSGDVVIGAIGLDLNTEIARRAGLRADNGVMVNSFLQSDDRDIYAAGDIAHFPSKSLDKNVRIEHWDNARAQGKHAGANMAGAEKPFEYLPYFYSDLFDLGFEAVGELDSRMKTFADWKEVFREGVVYYLDNGRVKGVLLWNVWEQTEAARKVIGMKKEYEDPAALRGALGSS